MLVDYAHTPDSLENVLRAARALGRAAALIAVFGCGGDRDRGKRPQMGAIAADARRRLDRDLRQPALGGPAGDHRGDPRRHRRRAGVEAIEDRREAIARAIALAGPGDVVVIAGKGHERGQEFADGRTIPFDDAEVAARGAARRAREGLDARARRRGAARGAAARRAARRTRAARRACAIDSRALAPGELFVGLRGAHDDGGRFAAAALAAGAWGVLVAARSTLAGAATAAGRGAARGARPARRARRARARALAARAAARSVVAITGSTGKTSTKDILAALLAPTLRDRRERAQPQHRDRRCR